MVQVVDHESRQLGSRKVFDMGCGNGAFMMELLNRGYDVMGVDPSVSGVELAKSASPQLQVFEGSTDEDLKERYGSFPLVVSLEVIEHVYRPRVFAARVFDLLLPGGVAIITTPFHGYLKNVALALAGKMDAHFTALWDYGHFKFFSISTLTTLLSEAGFSGITYEFAGRVYPFSKSMIAVARKPS